MRLIALMSALSAPLSAGAVEQAIDYSHCNSGFGGFYQPAYRIGEDGSLEFKPNDKRIIAFNKSDSEEALTMREFWVDEDSKGNFPDYKSKVILKRDKGKALSVETQLDPKQIEAYNKTLPKEAQDKPKFSGYKTTFAFNGDKCFVKEMSSTMTDGKKKVHYEHNFCNDVLKAVKKATMKKLVECKSTFAQVNETIKKYKESLAKEGSELALGMMGSPVETAEPGKPDSDWAAIMAAGSCNMTRTMHGVPTDPDTQYAMGMPFAIGVGIGGMAPPPAERTNSDPAN